MAPYLLDNSGLDPARSILDLVDVDSDKWRQYAATARWPKNWIFQREAEKLLELERDAADKFGATLLVSAFEASTFASLAPEAASRIHVVCNGVDLKCFSPGTFPNPFPNQEIPIVMTGRMDYPPNADGALWFAREVMPELSSLMPRARFHIVGSKPPASLRALKGHLIEVWGQVADIRPYLQHAAVVVAPLRMARGVQNKVLEALAMARPVVATLAATRALKVTSGSELWIENDPAPFARAVFEAAQGKTSKLVAQRGRNYVERCHDWQTNLAPLGALLSNLEQGRLGMAAASCSEYPGELAGRDRSRTERPRANLAERKA